MVRKDYYFILGVSRTESPSGIREAFRTLAKRYHPDYAGPQSTRFFQDIVEAYHVLSDPEKRRLYNQGLRHSEGQAEAPGAPIVMGQWPQPEPLVPEPMSLLRGFHTVHPSAEALSERLRRNFTGLGVPKAERLEALSVEVILSPDEALRGGVVPIGVPVFYPCPVCGGSGHDWFFPCTYCRQQGMVAEEEVVRIQIPPLVRDGTVTEVPIRGLGIHNLYLRLYIRVSP
ncbi:MAG: DnaJ domain-containing protein [Thermodesulfobacteriota bacterium]